MICLETNKICGEQNIKCKQCKLNDCKEVIKMIDEQEKYEDRFKLKCIKAQLPEQCKSCSFLEVIDLRKQKVYCPYMIKDRCLL